MSEQDDALSKIAGGYKAINLKEAAEGVRQLAMIAHEYFAALRQQGFSEEQALELLKEWQRSVLRVAGQL